MKDIIYVTGHKNPDSDSICAAIAYAEFKNITGTAKVVPLRQGELSRETQFILDFWGVEKPQLLTTMKLQVSDLEFDRISPVQPEISLKMAWAIMKKNNVKTLSVVDDNSKLKGIVSVSNLTSTYMDIWDNTILAKSNTKIENILDTLSAKSIYLNAPDPIFPGKIVIAAMLPSSAEEHIDAGDVVICGDRQDTQAMIINSKASLMIVTGNHAVNENIVEMAKESGCSIISSPHDSFTASRLIVQSIPISYVMISSDILKFSTTDYVEDIKDVMLKTRYRSYPVVNNDNNVVGGVSRYHLISQKKKKVILVDHNERSQAVDGLEDAEILEIIDHHRLGDIQTGYPIYFRNQPVGSSCTIVASIFLENGIRPSKKIAGLLTGALISDTLMFRSPTTTETDRQILKTLTEITGIDPEDFAAKMFKAGTSLEGKTVSEIFNQDYKVFALSKLKIGVSQVTTMDIDGFDPMKGEMLDYMNKKVKGEGFDLLLLLLTDILKGGSQLFVAGPSQELVSKAFSVNLVNGSAYAPGILSRKKQVIPPLTSAIEENN